MLHELLEKARISEIINYSICINQKKKDFMQKEGHE